jgi:outer membrane receptor protein involved in Fe transport
MRSRTIQAGWLGASAIAATLAAPVFAQAADSNEIIVTAPGGDFDLDEAQGVGVADIRASGQPDVFGALTRSVPGVSLQEAQDNPFQPNLVYRGFTASPLQGQAQGLAVYLDGARFNQPFGDTVQFDLLPEAAIERLNLLHASPVYGLNALGGAVTVETRTGRSAPGVSGSASLGSYGASELTGEAGGSSGPWSAYLALQHIHDDGWRRFSPSTLTNGFADLGWDGEKGGVHLKLIGADTDLTGNGSAPVELLRADYRAVFTWPDNTRNRYGRASLHPWLALGAHTRLEASLYWQHLRQSTLNGDAADVAACDGDSGLLCLEGADDSEAPLRDTSGAMVPDSLAGDPYGVLNRSRTSTTAGGVLGQMVDRRPLGGGENVFVVGASYDGSRTRFTSNTELGALIADRGVDGLGPIIDQPDGAITPVSLRARTGYTGLFVSDRLPLTHSLTAELGLRWNDEAIHLRDRIGTALDGDHHFRRLDPGIEFDWQLSNKAAIHAGYSEASRAPTPAELSCADATAPCSLTNFFVGDPPLKQVVAHSFDFGGQGSFGPFQWLIAAWRTTSDDDIQFVSAEVRGRAFFRNVGRTRRQGLEATLGYRKGALLVRAGYAFTDATFRTPFVLNSPDNPSADDSGQIQVLVGDRLPGVPRHRALLSADYRRPRWSLGADLQAASGQYLFGDEANLERRTHAYVVANLRASVKIAGPLHLFGEVTNVFDRHYATYGTFSETDQIYLQEAPGASDPRSLSPGAPRRWLVGLRAAF